MITKYGYGTLLVITVIAFLIFFAAFFIKNPIVKYSLISFGFAILIFSLNFFRDPERTTPNIENAVISPADGKILVIKKVVPNEFISENCIQVSIFMSPLNVHVNRIPINGKIEYLKYYKGEYLVAYHDKADTRNERMMIGVTGKFGKVLFSQVAGTVARRIITDLKENQKVKAGQRFGMIKFGSRVDVILPENALLKVKVGDKVTAGETILFEYKDDTN
ncbi:MAG TPA: phosphatidylserine decarboxylase family protein [Melioribacteraceae bacterium]|nr:phosphatidylserine decarboxylase family protein [Melioribacteraceae bacterium]